ncbi:MAG: prephenate dehydrogenase [Candidatus Acidiferrales bacterium]
MSDASFSRIAILGTGLIGGSFGLALRNQGVEGRIIGWDRDDPLRAAFERGAVDEMAIDLEEALRGADLIYLALPIGATIDLLPTIAAKADPDALVTDACSTKSTIHKVAGNYFQKGARFLGGHPMAGKEVSGIEHADAAIFRGARYAFIAAEDDPDPRVERFATLARRIGSEVLWCDAETHDWAVGIVSHLPQLVSVALARMVLDETDETGLPITLAGHGLRDLLRIAGSPYEVWRDVCLTNTENIAKSIDRLLQVLDHLRTILKNRELEDEFHSANELYKILREMK